MKFSDVMKQRSGLLALVVLAALCTAGGGPGAYEDDGCDCSCAGSGCSSRPEIEVTKIEIGPYESLDLSNGWDCTATKCWRDGENWARLPAGWSCDTRGCREMIARPIDPPKPAPVLTAPAAPPPPRTGDRVLRTARIERGKWPQIYVDATKGASMPATARCNGWGWPLESDPKVFPGDTIRVCGE